MRVDALRGLAALSVALYHVRTELWVGWTEIRAHPGVYSLADQSLAFLGVPMRFMGAGVLLFFVISGFCIHGPQACQDMAGQHRVDWPRFMVRRLLRIYPPYLAAVILSVVVVLITTGLSASDGQRFFVSILMLQNHWPPGGQISVNSSLWSLPVEMELYLAYPLAWWLGRRVGWAVVLGGAIALSSMVQLASMTGDCWLDNGFLPFLGAWCTGAWMAEQRCRNAIPAWNAWWCAGLALAIVVAIATELMVNLHGLSSWLWTLVGGLALVWASSPTTSSMPVGKCRYRSWVSIVAGIGTFSYSLYLIHYPLFHLAGHVWQQQFGAKPASILISLAAVLLVVPLAQVFHRCIEAPSHRLARRLGKVAGR